MRRGRVSLFVNHFRSKKLQKSKREVESVASRFDLRILNLCKIQVELRRSKEESTDEEAPTELNTENIPPGFLEVSEDNLSARYIGENLNQNDVGVIQANRPVPKNASPYYFEMYVKDAGENREMAIGFSKEGFKMRKQPGTEKPSYGYHGDDGRLHYGPSHNLQFDTKLDTTFKNGDVVGAGINQDHHQVFFTKNMEVVGKHIDLLLSPKFPTIGIYSTGAEVTVNFGQKQFAYDLENHEEKMKKKQEDLIPKMNETADMIVADEPLSPSTAHGLVRSYLLHSGYEETLNAFASDGEYFTPPVQLSVEGCFKKEDLAYELYERKNIRQLIRNGDIDASLSILQNLHPQVLQDEHSAVCFLLHCQKFIELVRAEDYLEAIMYGKKKLDKYHKWSTYNFLTKECLALLAHSEPRNSDVGYLLDDEWREFVADVVNTVILDTNPDLRDQLCGSGSFHSYIEALLLHLQFCCHEGEKLFLAPFIFKSCLEDDSHICNILP